MKVRAFLAGACVYSVVAMGQQKESAPERPSPAARKLEARISVLRDGGSAEIFIPAFGSKAQQTILVDGRSGSKTSGEVYLPGTLPVPGEDGEPVSHAEAEGYFQQLEEVLIAHYGAEKLLNLVLHPIEPGVHMSEKEFVDKLSDPKFDDLLEARYLLREVIAYRSRHGQAVTKPEK